MPLPAIIAAAAPFLTTAAVWLGRLGLAAFAINEFRRFADDNEPAFANADSELSAAGVTESEKKQLVAAFTYDKVESEGQDPDDFWSGLTPAEKEALEFSPDSLRNSMGRTKFLGLASAFLFVASLFSTGIAAKRGLPIMLSTLAKLRDARKAKASAGMLMTIIEEGKIAAISRVWGPAAAATFLGASGWWSAGMANNFNDAELWGRIFLGQAADDFEKAASERSKLLSGGTGTGRSTPSNITIVRMVEEKKPEQFTGTLFSSKLGRAESFERQVDTEITDLDDLRDDVKINLNRWLASLPNRMGYSVVVRQDPVDEFGVKQSGIWATLTLFVTHISGKTSPIDTILLGPVNPKTRLELTKQTKTIENEIEGFIEATQVREVQVPSGSVDIFNEAGDRVTPSTVSSELSTVSADSTEVEETVSKDDTEKKAVLEDKLESAVDKLAAFYKKGSTVISNTPGSRLNLRSRSDTRSGIRAKIPHNTRLDVVRDGISKGEGGYFVQVAFKEAGKTTMGWVSIQFVKVT